MHNVGQLYTTTEALSEQSEEFLFAPNSSKLKQEIILYKSLELGQTIHVFGYNSVDSRIIGNMIDNSVPLEQLEQH